MYSRIVVFFLSPDFQKLWVEEALPRAQEGGNHLFLEKNAVILIAANVIVVLIILGKLITGGGGVALLRIGVPTKFYVIHILLRFISVSCNVSVLGF